jgi:hypothetical protein
MKNGKNQRKTKSEPRLDGFIHNNRGLVSILPLHADKFLQLCTRIANARYNFGSNNVYQSFAYSHSAPQTTKRSDHKTRIVYHYSC